LFGRAVFLLPSLARVHRTITASCGALSHPFLNKCIAALFVLTLLAVIAWLTTGVTVALVFGH
jgi:hypothetical protein